MRTNNNHFVLYPCCVVVDGKTKSAIYDLQRERFWLVPHALSHLLKYDKGLSIGEIKHKYIGNEETIDEYIKFLLNNELGWFCDGDELKLKPIREKVENPHLITNAILDYNDNSDYDLHEAILQLEETGCENLEIRFYNKISMKTLEQYVSYTKDSRIRDLEILIQYSNEMSLDNLLKLRYLHSRIRKMTVSACPKEIESIYSHEEIYIIFTAEKIDSEQYCGVISPWYMLPKTELYIESLFYNNCLNRKISVDKYGYIKNCPSMKKIYGKIGGSKRLVIIASQEDFQKLWKIRKDDIHQCRDCELRYMCQDCRAYITNSNDMLSKPLKCNYNPYKE